MPTGGLFGIGGKLSFGKGRVTSQRNVEPVETSADNYLSSRWNNYNSRKIAHLTEKEDTSRMQRNKSYSSSISLILNKNDDKKNDVSKPGRVQRSHTTLGLGAASGGTRERFQPSFLSSRNTGNDTLGSLSSLSTLSSSSAARRSQPVQRTVSKRGSCINFGSEFLLDSQVFLRDSDDEDDVPPIVQPPARHRRPPSMVMSNGTDSNPPSYSFRRSQSFHQTMKIGMDSTDNNNVESASTKRYSSESDFTTKFSTKASDAIKEANEKRQELVDHVLNYKANIATKKAELSLQQSIQEIEQEVKARFNEFTTAAKNRWQSDERWQPEQPEEPKQPFVSRFLKRPIRTEADADDWSEKEWKKFIDDGVLIEMAVEVVVLLGRNPKPNFIYEPDTPVPRPYAESPSTIIVSQPPTPTDKYGRKKRDKGGEVPDHHTIPVIPSTDDSSRSRGWQSWGSSMNLFNRKAYESRRETMNSRRESISGSRQSIAASDSSSTPTALSGQSSRPTSSRPASNVFDEDPSLQVDEKPVEKCVSSVTVSMNSLSRYNRLATY